jgi:hypothetical protein
MSSAVMQQIQRPLSVAAGRTLQAGCLYLARTCRDYERHKRCGVSPEQQPCSAPKQTPRQQRVPEFMVAKSVPDLSRPF